MKPVELQELATAHVSVGTDDKGNKVNVVSKETVSLSPLHSNQFNELVGKVKLKDKPVVTRLSKKAIAVKAADLVAVLEAAAQQNVELENPEA